MLFWNFIVEKKPKYQFFLKKVKRVIFQCTFAFYISPSYYYELIKTYKRNNMSKTTKLFDEIKGYYETFETEHEKNVGGNKAAGGRARKAIGELKKLVTEYRKASVAGE